VARRLLSRRSDRDRADVDDDDDMNDAGPPPVDYDRIRTIVREEVARDKDARIKKLEAELWFVVEHGMNQSRILKVLTRTAAPRRDALTGPIRGCVWSLPRCGPVADCDSADRRA